MRLRSGASVVFAVLGMLVLLVGTVAFYARQEVVNREAFADRALAALEDDGVRVVVRDEIVDGLIDRGSGDLVAARPLLESIVDVVIDSEPFRAIFTQARALPQRTPLAVGPEKVVQSRDGWLAAEAECRRRWL